MKKENSQDLVWQQAPKRALKKGTIAYREKFLKINSHEFIIT